MTRTAKKMFKDMGYEYSEKYTTDDEKALEYIQYEKECEIIKFYIAGKFWGKCHKKGVFGSKYEYDKYAYATAEETEAIIQQCQELDWVDEKICTNFTDPTSDYFICSNCGIYLEDFSQTVLGGDDKRNVNQDGYELRYCPNCGCKIVDYDHFAKKAKYKVTQFEFDLLNTYRFCSDSCKFHNCTQLREMKVKGYFKDVDANATIHDILWNCGVIKDGNC